MAKYQNQLLLILILAIGFIFRFWRLEDRVLFSGEATNEMLALQMLTNGETSPLLGYPVATYLPNLFTTPWIWWLILPIFIFFKGNPLPFLILHPLLSLFGIFCLYLTGKLIHSDKAGLIAAFLYASWMYLVNIDRSVWNVGLIPTFVNFLLLAGARAYKQPTPRSFLLLGLILGLAISLHYQLLVSTFIILLYVLLKRRRFFLWPAAAVIVSLLPILIYDLSHQFITATAFLQAVKSLSDGSRHYATGYFWYQFLPPTVLLSAVALSKITRQRLVFILTFFAAWQFILFKNYQIKPNFSQRVKLIKQILSYWRPDSSLTILINDRPYFEYGYLLLYYGRSLGVTEDSIARLEHDGSKNNDKQIKLIRNSSLDTDAFSPSETTEMMSLLDSQQAILVLDEDKTKLLPIESSFSMPSPSGG